MNIKKKAKQLALTLVDEEQNPEPLIKLLTEMGEWCVKEMLKNAVDGIAGDFCVYNCDFRRMKKFPFGQKVKVVIFKRE